MAQHPVTAVIVGGGHRAIIYADYSLKHPDELKIVGIADPNAERCKMAAERYGFSEEFCFSSAEELARQPRLARAVINGTMDHQHYETSAPLLEKGYDMLLEKPFAVNKAEMERLLAVVRRCGSRVMVCHVLRYTPFYLAIKNRILAGELGDIINIQTAEHVSYHHLSTAYVRGKWANSDVCKTSMLLAKSCHDIDIMMWLMQPVLPKRVSSFGSIYQFKPENAPANAGARCTVDCPLVDTCRYSAKKLYLQHPNRWECYVWDKLEHLENPTHEDRLQSFAAGNPYDRCIYKCGNNVVDHQSVLVEFAGGATGTHNMIGGSAKSLRKIHIIGTKAELDGELESGVFTVRKIAADEESGYTEETVNVNADLSDTHGGGDDALTADFVHYIATGEQSVSCTAIENSVAGHLTVFLADQSREKGGMPMDTGL
ncbi:MAG: Gfo/Idh/MocA family oxidoreductase [Clostridia bacterium]|nr:Gfo/Idh/MocA family oxidoreductase [Clostridia bacterium]